MGRSDQTLLALTKLQDLEEGMKDRDMSALLERLAGLEGENRGLRDRNDELSLQVEDLTSRLHSASIDKRCSPSTSMNLSVDAAMREVPSLCVDNGGVNAFSDVECDDMDGDIGEKPVAPTPVCGLKLKAALVEKLQALGESVNAETCELVAREVESALTAGGSVCDCSNLQATVTSLQGDLTKLKEEDEKLRKRCQDLEKSMELLQEEYERTEDYWTAKLEEERNLFDAEQRQSDEKYSELVNKILEYEQLMKEEVAARQRLETIEEKDGLERQVQELEEEYSKLLSEKDSEIEKLQREINTHPPVNDALAQTDFSPVGSESSSQHTHCRRSLTFSSGDRRKHCCKVYRLQGEVRSLIEAKQSAQSELSSLLAERDLLYKQVLTRRREASCSANLNGKLLCAERRCRSLMSTLRNQQLQTSELLRSSYLQHKRELNVLRTLFGGSATKGSKQPP